MTTKALIRTFDDKAAIYVEQVDEQHLRMSVAGQEMLITNE